MRTTLYQDAPDERRSQAKYAQALELIQLQPAMKTQREKLSLEKIGQSA
jgi:hypothetical protein